MHEHYIIEDIKNAQFNQLDEELSRRTNQQCALSSGSTASSATTAANDRSRLSSLINAQQQPNSPGAQAGSNANMQSSINRQMNQLIQVAINAGYVSPQVLFTLFCFSVKHSW